MGNKTGFVYHELYAWHDSGNWAGFLPPGFPVQPGMHVEHPETKRRFKNLLDASGFIDELHFIKPISASDEDILRFHTEDYFRSVKQMSEEAGGDAGELTQVGLGSFEIAKLSAGGVIEATKAVLSSHIDNAYVLARPPGHHADADMGRGFCIFGNIVIAIKHAQAQLGVGRVAVVDWDVHHGNGTETAFYDDPNVLTISLHQDNWYPPERGLVSDIGTGDGEGFAVNVPLPPGTGMGAYESAFDRIVIPALDGFKPEMIFVASGFDGSAFDPLGRMMMHSKGYASLTQKLMAAADSLCDGRLVMAHEGGYSPSYVPFCGLAVLEALAGKTSGVEDPFLAFAEGMAGQGLQPHQQELIATVEKQISRLKDL
ncbi:MAG TPA: class II histone deacetylase [Rhodobiaceae bacterium]|nr:class II histone deacetylase [Rhodobiaceae bacterium]